MSIEVELLRVGMPPSLMGLRWAVDMDFARDWLQARVSAMQPDEMAARPPLTPAVSRGVAVIPVRGVLTQRAGMCSLGCEDISFALHQAMADPNVGGVLLSIDSPGGSTFGVDELAAEVMAMRSTKPIWAHANSRMDSAAYWLGSAANQISVTPGGEVGSIGVYMVHQAEEGTNVNIISAGKYKVEVHPYAPLSDEARASLQARVDHDYGRFVARVAAGRGVPESTVRDGYGEGRALPATRALEEGMVDRIETHGEALARLAATVATGAPATGVARAEDNEEMAALRARALEYELQRIELETL